MENKYNTIEFKNQDIEIIKTENKYLILWGKADTKTYDHSMSVSNIEDYDEKTLISKSEYINIKNKHLFKAKKPSKFEIVDYNEETNFYLVKNLTTRRIFEITKKEFKERFEKI